MIRRTLCIVVLLAAGPLVAWGLHALPQDPRRAAVVLGLGVIGIGLNLTGAARSTLPLRGWLRGLAVAVATVVAVAVLVMHLRLRIELLPDLPDDAAAMREAMQRAATGLLWITAALAHVIVGVLLLPRFAAQPPVPKFASSTPRSD